MENKLSEAQGQYLFWKLVKKIFQKQDYYSETNAFEHRPSSNLQDLKPLRPITSVQRAVLNRLGNMFDRNVLFPA
jgi:hypothetical protein